MELKMTKRDLFVELKYALTDATAYEQEKLTLKTTTVIPKERILLSADEIRAIRENTT